MSLIYLSCAWVAGIFLGAKFNIPLTLVFSGLIPLPLLFFTRQHRKAIILVSLCLVTLFGGAFYFQLSLPRADEQNLQFYNDRGVVEIKGTVDRDPEPGDKTTHLQLSAREIRLAGEWSEVSGTALLFVPRYPTYNYGDVLLVKGGLNKPPQLGDFNYEQYLANQEIYSTMLYPEVAILDRGEGFKPLEWVYSLRNHLSQTLTEILPEPQASLAQGIILGMRGNIPSSVTADFSRSGTTHILAISGQNLTIVAGILLSLGIWLFGRRRYLYIWLALGVIWLYTLLTGMQPPVLRAAIMASLFLTAELLGRQRSSGTALVMAAAVMVGISPQILWTASFQMSFVAMAGLIFIFPLLQSLGRKAVSSLLGESRPTVSIANFIVDSFSISLGAIIAVWPLITYYFGIISWVAPLANFFALPVLPGIIIAGTLAGGLGFFFLPAAQVIAWLAWFFLSYMLLVVKIFATISPVKLESVSTNLIWIYYSGLVLLIWLISNRQRWVKLMPGITDWLKSAINKSFNLIARLPKKWVLPPLAVVAILVSVTAATMPDNNLHVSVLDVGQGDAILIQKGNRQILVDGGPSPQALVSGLGREMPFWDRTIDLVVSTHPDNDHITGLVEVLKRYQIEQVLYPDLKYDSPGTINNEWLSLVRAKNIKYTLAQAGQRINFGDGVIVEVLNPQKPFLISSEAEVDNNNSVVLRLKMGDVSFLLTADIQAEAELELIARRANLTSTVLKVAHHGSATSTSAPFLAVVNPRVAVISVGAGNSFGHPNAEVMDRLKQKLGQQNIYRTDEHATIEFITDGEGLWVRIG
ncbi:MAG: DNA internalization-related competence protein ComEC/Rec2 [Chloroflexi bacterium]|nr:DNA internalization-related competence protein ComEC/Rec2 [Chloroflexota bacterium]